MKRPRSGVLLSAWLSLGVGCAHTHLDHNAPGHIDVATPPEDLAAQKTELPEDPGERLLVLSAGAFSGLGWGFYDDDVRTDWAVGPELGLALGQNPRSHYEDDFFLEPRSALGVRLGLNALDREQSGLGPAFGEIAYTETLVRLSGGWAWDPGDARHGPQATLAFGPIYARATHLLDTGTSLHLGVTISGSHTWVWSQ